MPPERGAEGALAGVATIEGDIDDALSSRDALPRPCWRACWRHCANVIPVSIANNLWSAGIIRHRGIRSDYLSVIRADRWA